MESGFGGNYGTVLPDLMKAAGKKSIEWDLNDWSWDGDHFTATRLDSSPLVGPSDISGHENRQKEVEKRGREDSTSNDEAGFLNLKLGGRIYPITETEMDKAEGKKNGKKSKTVANSNQIVCQVEDCHVDLSDAKDYNRRHKVCEIHSKAGSALIGNLMKRFCQQCSRFHDLQEFDDGKRSCRRRLAGHNKRRRKSHSETVGSSGFNLEDDRGSGYLLLSLLKILSNLHTNNSEQMKDQDLVSHLLRSLAGTIQDRSTISDLPSGSQEADHVRKDYGSPEKPNGEQLTVLTSTSSPAVAIPRPLPPKETNGKRTRMDNIDLNNFYEGSQDDILDITPPKTSRNSGSLSNQSPSSSSREAQSRTDRIIFKLFGKDPSDCPLLLRKQILDWLSNSPTDIESYIRPGCIILTLYLRLDKSSWKKHSSDLSSSLIQLLNTSNEPFWRSGWLYASLQHRVAFMYNGQVVLDTPLPFRSHEHCSIFSIKPLAVPLSKKANFLVKGFNLSSSSMRLFCALEGKYLPHETYPEMMDGDKIQCVNISCHIPNVDGRGFIEVEDHSLSSSFFPFIVAEEDVCSEICKLQATIDGSEGQEEEVEARNQALDFLHEMGWLLHRSKLKTRSVLVDLYLELFSFNRFKWLLEFSVEHDWCAVVKKLLGILKSGCVEDAQEYTSFELAISEMALLHTAVRRDCRPMVEFLLRYSFEGEEHVSGIRKFWFRPDSIGPGGLTPLHLAASREGSHGVLDALLDDPGLVGVNSWKSARDNMGLTPHDYACLRGNFSYINLFKKKTVGHVVLDIPMKPPSKLANSLNTERRSHESKAMSSQMKCRLCKQKKMGCGSSGPPPSLPLYKPAMLSMVAIAAVCVCAALLFKSSPEVLFVFRPFRWDLLKYGSS